MKKRLGALLATAMLAAVLVGVTASSPASATEVCVGQGSATISNPLFYPVVGPPAPAGTAYDFGINTGVCTTRLLAGELNANGTMTGVLGGGHCGQSSSANGVISPGSYAFGYTSAGSILIINPRGTLVPSGPVAAGVANAIPNAVTGESCTSGADNFLVTGAIALID